MTTQDCELGKWIKGKFKSQVRFAGKIGAHPTLVSRWMGGAGISEDYQAAIRKLGFDGPWPEDEAKDAAAGGPANYVTRDEFIELRGAVKAHIESWERGEEKVLQRLMDALRRIDELEKRL